MQNPKEWEYFAVHIAADKEHAAQERQLLKSYVTEDNQEMISNSVNKIIDHLWNFLSSICSRHHIVCAHS